MSKKFTFIKDPKRFTAEVGRHKYLKLLFEKTDGKYSGPTSHRVELDAHIQGYAIDKETFRKYTKTPVVLRALKKLRGLKDTNIPSDDVVASMLQKYLLKKYSRYIREPYNADKNRIGWLNDTILIASKFRDISDINKEVRADIQADFKRVFSFKKRATRVPKNTFLVQHADFAAIMNRNRGSIALPAFLLGNTAKRDGLEELRIRNPKGGFIVGTTFDSGHLQGGAVDILKHSYEDFQNILDRAEDFGFDEEQVQALLTTLKDGKKNFVDKAIKIDADIEHSTEIRSNGGIEANYVLSLTEETSSNRSTGSLAGTYLKNFRKSLLKNPLTREMLDVLLHTGQSKNLIEALNLRLQELFFEGKGKGYKKVTKWSDKLTVVQKLELTTPLIKSTSKKKSSRAKQKQPSSPLSLQSLIMRINSRLHDTIQKNMGKGGAYETLNYRTGRFAHSAKLLNMKLTPSGRAFTGSIDYMNNPYSVFAPGGRLYRPLRDPKVIINKSIRQLLKEELGRPVTFTGTPN